MKKYFSEKKVARKLSIIFLFPFIFFSPQIRAQGTWMPISAPAPDYNFGSMLLLSDGSVIVKTSSGNDQYGNIWDKLSPDSFGSYVNGTWSTIAPMNDTRLYMGTQMLPNGNVYVVGGEYGTGSSSSEIYDPTTDTWTLGNTTSLQFFDCNSEILPDGKVLVGAFDTTVGNYDTTIVFDPVTNSFVSGQSCVQPHDESSWVKLPDESILFVSDGTFNSERFIPATNQWIADANVPCPLYDYNAYECGAAFLLPNGKAVFFGGNGKTAIYTPSGNTNPGSWITGPMMPTGLGTPDAAGAMMVNGKILCALSPIPSATNIFPSPTYFYEFDYTTNSFTQVLSPIGIDTTSEPCYYTNMVDLPDGTILYGEFGNDQYYVYSPSGAPLASGKPTINTITQNGCTYTITGTLFNGISEGSAYGDDWQMASNYPIVRMTQGLKVYYARTFDWNRTDVQTGNLLDTAQFTLPTGIPAGNYSLVVTANGIASNPFSFNYTPCPTGISENENPINNFLAFTDASNDFATVKFNSNNSGKYKISMTDISGKIIRKECDVAIAGENSEMININGIAKGTYVITLEKENDIFKTKIVVE